MATDDNVLVAGRRRLAAIEKLGWKKAPVRRFEKMSPEEPRELELEENTLRLDLSDYEISKKMVDEAEAEKPRGPRAVSKGGRGNTGGTRAQAEAAGVPESSLRLSRRNSFSTFVRTAS